MNSSCVTKKLLASSINAFRVTVLKAALPVLTFERHLGRGVSQNRRQKRKQPGLKRSDGDYIRRGETIVQQFYLNFHPGLNVRIDQKNTLRAMTDGKVVMSCEEINPKKGDYIADKYYGNFSAPVFYKKFLHVLPFTQGQKFKLVDLV